MPWVCVKSIKYNPKGIKTGIEKFLFSPDYIRLKLGFCLTRLDDIVMVGSECIAVVIMLLRCGRVI